MSKRYQVTIAINELTDDFKSTEVGALSAIVEDNIRNINQKALMIHAERIINLLEVRGRRIVDEPIAN